MKLEIKNLVKVYKGRRVVNDVSLGLVTGEIVGLLGPNGAGKTTTFYMMVGLVRPDDGRVLLQDKDITTKPMYRRARLGLGYLAQEPSIFRKLTVAENLLLVQEMNGISRRDRAARTDELLEEFGLVKLRNQKGQVLSGGERRRVEIARALATNPKLILLDEPFTGVDPIAIGDIQDLVRKLKNKGIGIVITDHNVRETLAITDRAYIMSEGEIKTSGESSKLPNDPIARKFYLGERFEM
ncbi:MAG: LPS export ABC transporter ATP-binding protein [Armatimonadetes bacterium]|nr:LPS export ABC transporter ATP-binding protein [Armatimonadota bacterium]